MRTVATLFLLSGALHAQPDYFPLILGSQWIYRSDGPGTFSFLTMEVVRTQEFGGNQYALVRGLTNALRQDRQSTETWLRRADDGALWAWDETARQEKLFINFAAAENESWPTLVDPCNSTGRIVSRNARYSGPLGDFVTALETRYSFGGCADAGLEGDVFLPYVGLVRRTSQTIAGPRHFNLIYARVGTATVVSEKELSFGLTVDRSVYTANLMPPVDPRRSVPVMTARITLRNTQDEPLRLTMPSGQMYDLVIRNDKGETVYSWSKDKVFPAVIGMLEVVQGEKNFVISAPLALSNGQPLPQGRYIAEAWLTTDGPRQFSASVGFEVRHVF